MTTWFGCRPVSARTVFSVRDGPAELERCVDLVRPVARDVDAEVAWDREIGQPVPAGVGANEQDRVGAACVGPRSGLVAVGAEQQDQRRLRREQRPPAARGPASTALGSRAFASADAGAEGEVARDAPDDEEHEQDEQSESDPSAPARPARRAPRGGRSTCSWRSGRGAVGTFPFGPAALVDPVGLLSVRHPAGYGSRGP